MTNRTHNKVSTEVEEIEKILFEFAGYITLHFGHMEQEGFDTATHSITQLIDKERTEAYKQGYRDCGIADLTPKEQLK